MSKKPLFDKNDPYSQAISSLVKKTLLILGVFFIVGIAGAGYLLTKSGLKLSGSSKKVATAEVLAAQKEQVQDQSSSESTIAPTATPAPSNSAAPSPMPTNSPTPTPSPSPTSKPTNSPTPAPTSPPVTKTRSIKSTGQLDGYIDSKGGMNTGAEIRIGSTKNAAVRGFLSFDISSIDIKELNKAKLRIYQTGDKNNPFQNGTDIRIDSVNFGSSLDPSDYSTSSLNSSFATVTNSNAVGWKEVEITELVKNAKKDGRQNLQFRLHFNFETEGTENYVNFESGENAQKTNNIPEIQLE